MLKRFLVYYKPHKKLLTLDLLASLLISVIGMVYPVVTRTMLNDYIPNRLYSAVIIAGAVVLGLYVVRMLLRYFVQYYGHLIGVRMQSRMRQDLFAHLLSAGTKGKRMALPNSEIMIHQPSAGTQGQITDMAIHMKRLQTIKERMNRILAENVGKDVAVVTEACERDNFMTAEEAKEFGLIDRVLDRH